MRSAGPSYELRDVEFRDPDEARDALQTRTSRINRIQPRGRRFHLRYRSLAFTRVHISRTWESDAEFDIDGQAVPVVFFPVAGSTLWRSGGQERRFTPDTAGCFTVAKPGSFTPARGYSEIVLRLDPDLLASYLRLLESEADLPAALRAAALRDDLPGMPRLRALALDLFDGFLSEPEPFRAHNARIQQEALALRAAAVLATGLNERMWAPPQKTHPSLNRAIDFIAARLREDFTLADVATASGVSLRLLQTLFRAALGCTPIEYIRRQRLQHARRLLETGKAKSVTEAALEAGFTHLGKFSALYSQRFGEQPSKTLRRLA